MTTLTVPSGIFLIDKPKGASSHTVVNRVRWVTGVKKVGHAGTLDPLATGLLIVLVGKQYTRRQPEFLHLDKTYQVTAQLGVTTDTYDSRGSVVALSPWKQLSQISLKQVQLVLADFMGEVEQTVPAYSAVKVNGKKLYERAVAGTVDSIILPSKKIKIHELILTRFYLDCEHQSLTISLTVSCSSGTYIRSLVHDMGQSLKVGAMVTELRRLKIGDFAVEGSVALDRLTTEPYQHFLHVDL